MINKIFLDRSILSINYNDLLFEKIFNINPKIYNVEYKNKNEYDLRYNNLLIKFKSIPFTNTTIIKIPFIVGNNIYYEVQDNITSDIYYIINIHDKYILIDIDIFDLLKLKYKSQIWNIQNNVVSTKQLSYLSNKLLYNEINMHSLIFCYYTNIIYDKNINISKFNNSLNHNIINYTKININDNIKKARKINAKKLPTELSNIILPKYIVYYNETKLNKEYFKIENHPKLNKPWMTTTKKNVSITEKYNIIINKLNELNNIIPNQLNNIIIPNQLNNIIIPNQLNNIIIPSN
jgi:hypothetical protein